MHSHYDDKVTLKAGLGLPRPIETRLASEIKDTSVEGNYGIRVVSTVLGAKGFHPGKGSSSHFEKCTKPTKG